MRVEACSDLSEALDKKKHLHHSKACIPTRKFKAQKRKKPFRPWQLKKGKSPKKRTSKKPLKHLILGGNEQEIK